MNRIVLLLLFSVFFVGGCAALTAPTAVPIPTPVETAVSFTLPATANLIIDPVSNVVPTVNPEIIGLMESVSQQQLMGYVQTLERFGTRNAFSDIESDDFGIGAARRWIFSEFERVGNGRLQVSFQDFPLIYNNASATQQNVIATLPGNGKSDSILVIMAHYDNRAPDATDGETLAPGANDNASGVALLLETARLFSSREWNQTILFVALAAEEQGTFGARYLVQKLLLEDNREITAVLNYDGVGGRNGIPQNVRLFPTNLLQSPSGQLARYYEFIGGLYLPTFPVNVINRLDREGRWGDQREFVNVGVAAVRLIESEENSDLVNSKQDSWEFIDYHYLQQIVQLNVAVAANIAGAPSSPQSPTLSIAETSGNYQIMWPVDSEAAGYAIAFRPISEGGYPPFRFVTARDAGNVLLTGVDGTQVYAVSLAAIDGNGRLSYFSPEQFLEPVEASN